MPKPWEKYRQPDPYASDPYEISGGQRQPPPQTVDQAALTRAQAAQAAAEAAFAHRKAEADARKAEAEATLAAHKPDPSEINPADPKNRQRNANLRSLARQIDRVEELYRQSIEPTSGLSGFLDFLPTEANSQFNTASKGMAEQALAAFRVPGVGSQSDRELEQFVGANRPSASNYDTSIEEKIRQLRIRLDETLAQYGLPPSGQQQARQQDQQAAPVVSGQQPPQGPPPAQPGGPGMDRSTRMMFSGSPDQTTLAQGSFRRDNDPTLKGINARIKAMIVGGKSAQEIADYYGRVAPGHRLDMGSLQKAIEWQRQTKSKTGPDVDVDNVIIPMTTSQQMLNNAAQSATGAYAINAADTLTFGTLDNMTGNPEQTRAGMAGVNAMHPNAALAGQVTGGALAAGVSELGAASALARAPAALSRFSNAAPFLGDAVYGAGYGAGSADEGSRLWGAVQGAAAGVGGGVAGRKIASGTGRVLTGSRDAATRMLRERGIPQTIGDIAGRGGVVGKSVKRLENALESVPLLGAAISRRRAEGVEGFNRAAFREALEPIGANAASTIGEEGVEAARGSVSSAYDQALDGITVKVDPTFIRDMKRAVGAGQKLHPEIAGHFAAIVENEIAPQLAAGPLTGRGYQELRRILKAERAGWKSDPRGRVYGNALRQLEGALESLVRRRAPGVVEGLNRADKAFMRSKVVEGAVGRGANTSGVFSPAQLGMSAKQSANKFGGNGATTQRPFYELQRAAQDVLPSQVPNSGTADRLMAGALLPALPGLAGAGAAQAGLIDPETAALMASLGLPYTAAGRAALERILIDRPDLLRRAGQKVLDRKNVGGLLGAGAAAGALPAQ